MKEYLRALKFLWKYAKDAKKQIFLFALTNFISFIMSVVIPIVSALIIVKLTNDELYQLIIMGSILFILELIRLANNHLWNVLNIKIYIKTVLKMRSDLGKSMLRLENETLDKNSSGLFIQRLSDDTSRLSDSIGVLFDYIELILTNVGIFVAIFVINKLLFVYYILVVAITYVINKKRTKIWYINNKELRKTREKMMGFIAELVRGARDIKMLNSERSFSSRLNVVTNNNLKKEYHRNLTNNTYNSFRKLIDVSSTFIYIILCVYLIRSGNLTVALALVVYNYSSRISGFIAGLSSLSEWLNEVKLSANRIIEIFDDEMFPKETFGSKHLSKVKGNFEFKNVVFRYEKRGRKILDGINFKINANETVAFVGKTGVGKTTIFNLLCKMYEVDSGLITIDGVDIKELDKDSIRGNITIISQNPYIFNVSIKDNFKLVKKDVTDSEIKEACRLACLDKFINKLPDKYETIIGEGGINLSGGEKQRLAIARALIQKTKIILFDEATSALDNETQAHIQNAIDNMKGDYTVMIIAHRLSTIRNADRILFLSDGKIIAEGSHEQLLKNCKEYRELYETEIEKK